MRYEKTDPFDKLLEEAMSEVTDKEATELEAIDDSDVILSERLDRRIERMIKKESEKSTPRLQYRRQILSSAALLTIVTVCVVWLATMSAFGNLPHIGTFPPPTETSENPMGLTDPAESTGTMTEWTGTMTEWTGTMTEWTGSASDTQPPTSQTNKPHTPIKGNSFTSPSDEKKIARSFLASNTDGLWIEIKVHGYWSASLNKGFYLKSNEYFTVDVKVTSRSEHSVYQFLTSSCRESQVPHNHEIGIDLAHGGYALNSSAFGFACMETENVWMLEPQKTYTWTLKLAAGEKTSLDFDLSADGTAELGGIKLYDESIYTNGSCIFDGTFSFDYKKTDGAGPNDHTLSVPLSLEIVHVSE